MLVGLHGRFTIRIEQDKTSLEVVNTILSVDVLLFEMCPTSFTKAKQV